MLFWLPLALSGQSLETGMASYYADFLHGQPTAYGELYDRMQMTCAHKAHPLGTLLRITRLDTGKSVVARVNDRGPFTEGFVVNLSWAGALSLGLDRVGKARVQLEVVGYAYENPSLAPAEPVAVRSGETFTPKGSGLAPATPSSYDYQSPVPVSGRVQTSVSNPTVPQEYNAYPGQRNAYPGYSTVQERAPASAVPQSYNTYVGQKSAYPATTPPASFESRMPTAYDQKPVVANRAAPTATSGQYGIQLAAYGQIDNAQRQMDAYEKMGLADVSLYETKNNAGAVLFRLVIGPFASRTEAENRLQQVRSQVSGFVCRL